MRACFLQVIANTNKKNCNSSSSSSSSSNNNNNSTAKAPPIQMVPSHTTHPSISIQSRPLLNTIICKLMARCYTIQRHIIHPIWKITVKYSTPHPTPIDHSHHHHHRNTRCKCQCHIRMAIKNPIKQPIMLKEYQDQSHATHTTSTQAIHQIISTI